ncbi:MAG: DUF1569 domain-containing protein [Planctomycetota bacterium]
MPIDTKTAARRELFVTSVDELAGELDGLEAAMTSGSLTHTGNWTPGQIFDHCGKFMAFSYDGFPSKAPAPIRFVARLFFKKDAVNSDKPFPPGFKLPKQASALLPSDAISDADGLAVLRAQVVRWQAGERFEQMSPLLGPLTHDEWQTLHLKHCSMHMSFLHPGG